MPEPHSAPSLQFWTILKSQEGFRPEALASIQESQAAWAACSQQMDYQMAAWNSQLQALPMLALLQAALSTLESHGAGKAAICVLELLTLGLLDLLDEQIRPITVHKWLQHSPQHLLTRIRCRTEWTLLEREERVEYLLAVLHQISRTTHGLFPLLEDPLRLRIASKRIPYPVFLDALEELTPRDQLILQLLYFGAPTIESILDLEARQVDLQGKKLLLHEGTVSVPDHLLPTLSESLQNRTGTRRVFENSKGSPVERAHLNRCLARAREKHPAIDLTLANLMV